MKGSPAFPERLVIDGGLGSELERRGFDVTDHLWSARVLLEQSEQIEKIHWDYLEAGTECVISASYQVSFAGFRQAGLTDADAETALRKSVAVAQKARDAFERQSGRRALVAASVGPLGAARADGSEFHGNYGCTFGDLVEFHARRLAILANCGADLLACETIPSLTEAQAIVECLAAWPEARAWFSFQCADERHTAHGEELRECALLLDKSAQVVAVGVNCTAPQYVSSLIGEMRAATGRTVVVYPNAGRKWDAAARRWSGHAPSFDLGRLATEWREVGAGWIGGCCGTTPEDIARVAESTLRG